MNDAALKRWALQRMRAEIQKANAGVTDLSTKAYYLGRSQAFAAVVIFADNRRITSTRSSRASGRTRKKAKTTK